MAIPAHTDEELIEIVNHRKQFKTSAEAARALGIPAQTYKSRLERAAQRGLDGSIPKPLPPGQQIKGVSTLYRMDEMGEWEERLKWVKSKDDRTVEDFIASIKDVFESYKGRAELTPPPKRSIDDLFSVYPIADQHNGLLAWGKETGESYDLKIGADRLRNCMGDLVAQSPDSNYALILNLGDWQHNDDGRNVTPGSGNQLDVDGRYYKVLTTGVRLMMDCIDLALQKHAVVLVRNLPGNHDPHSAIALTVALSAFYHNEDRVVIDDDPSEFFFHRFGQTLIGANHGHRMKPADMAMNMACRRREDWGQTKYHWFLYGHIHHESAKEVGDVRCESFQTLAAKDAWSAAKGFNSGQSLTSVTLHHERGETGRHRINL